jgi:hypothetical protein
VFDKEMPVELSSEESVKVVVIAVSALSQPIISSDTDEHDEVALLHFCFFFMGMGNIDLVQAYPV